MADITVPLAPPPKPEQRNLVADAQHISALKMAAQQDGMIGGPDDKDAIEEYTRSKGAFKERYGISPPNNLMRGKPEQDASAGNDLAQSDNAMDNALNPEDQWNGQPPIDPGMSMQNEFPTEVGPDLLPKDWHGGAIPISDTFTTPEKVAQNQVEDKQKNDILDQLNSMATPKTVKSTAEKTPEQTRDPLGIRIQQGLAIGDAINSDIQTFVGEAIPQGLYGVEDAFREAKQHLESLGNFLNLNFAGDNGSIKDFQSVADGLIKDAGLDKSTSSETPAPASPERTGPDPKSVSGGFFRGAAQFTAGFIPALKVIKGLTWAGDAFKGARLLQTTLAGGSAGVTFDEHEANLFNLIETYGPEFTKPMVHALAANPGDSEAWGMAKQAMSGMVGNALADGLFAGLGLLKSSRQMKGVTAGVPPPKVVAEDFKPAVQVEHNAVETLEIKRTIKLPSGQKLVGKPGESVTDIAESYGLTKDDLAGAATTEKGVKTTVFKSQTKVYAGEKGQLVEDIEKGLPVEDQTGKVTKGFTDKQGKFHTADEMTRAVDEARIAQEKALTKTNNIKFSAKPGQGSVDETAYQAYIQGAKGSSIKKVLDTFSNTNITQATHIDQLIDRVGQLVAVKTTPPTVIKPVDAQKFADSLGITIAELGSRNPAIVANPSKFYAAIALVDASRNSIVRLSGELLKNLNNATSETALYNFLRAINNHQATLHYLRSGSIRETESLLKKMPVPKGDISAQVSQMAAVLAKRGGATKVRQLARAIAESGGNPATFEKALSGSVFKDIDGILQQYWYFNLLSGMATHVNNIVGNTFTFSWQIPIRAISAQVRKVRGGEGVVPGEATALAFGYVTSLKTAWKTAWNSFKTGTPADAATKLDELIPNYLTAEKFGWTGPAGKVIDMLGTVTSVPGRALLATDDFFKVAAKSGEIAAQALRKATGEGLTGSAHNARVKYLKANPDLFMSESAQQFARQITYTNPLGKIGQDVQSFLSRGGIMTKLLVPFIRTNTNIFKETVRNSPLSILQLPIHAATAGKFNADMLAGGSRSDIAISKFLLGSSVVAITTEAVLNDVMTGPGPSDPALQATWRQTHQPYSVWAGDPKDGGYGWVSYLPIVPISGVLAVTSSVAENYSMYPASDWEHTAANISLGVSKSVLNQIWLKNLSAFFNAVEDPLGHDGKAYWQKLVGTLAVPAGAAQITRALDPQWRELHNWYDGVLARLPGMSQSLLPRLNRAGQPIYSQSLGPDIISSFYQYIPDGKPFFKWGLDNQVNIGMPSQVQWGQAGVGGIKLEPEEYHQLVKLAGNELKLINGKGWYDLMNDILDKKDNLSGEWYALKDGPNGTKAMMAKQIANAYEEAAREALVDPSSKYYMPVLKKRLDKSRQQKVYNLTTGPGEMPQ